MGFAARVLQDSLCINSFARALKIFLFKRSTDIFIHAENFELLTEGNIHVNFLAKSQFNFFCWEVIFLMKIEKVFKTVILQKIQFFSLLDILDSLG